MNEFVLPVRVYLEDTDAQGVVYNASYFRFLERSRTEWMRANGVDHGRLRDEEGVVLVLVATQVKFREAATLDDQLFVRAALAHVTGVRFVFSHAIRRGAPDGDLLCDGVAEVVCMDVVERKIRRIPALITDELS